MILDYTFCVSSYNNFEYLKLLVHSVREYAYNKTAPFIIHTENCTDETNGWLFRNFEKYNLTLYVEPKILPARGIGGGMNYCASKVKTKYIIFLQSDFFVSKDFDLALFNLIEEHKEKKMVVSSFRVEPNIFNNREGYFAGNYIIPKEVLGAYFYDFKEEMFISYSENIMNENANIIRRGEGAGGYIIKKEDWDYIGGNDNLFAPTSWEDMDLFIRMQNEGFNFLQTSKSVIFHFAGRGSHRLEENNGVSCQRQKETEQINVKKFINKWGSLPSFDEYGFVKPIINSNVKNII